MTNEESQLKEFLFQRLKRDTADGLSISESVKNIFEECKISHENFIKNMSVDVNRETRMITIELSMETFPDN